MTTHTASSEPLQCPQPFHTKANFCQIGKKKGKKITSQQFHLSVQKKFVCNQIPSVSACWMQACIKSIFWNSEYYLAPAVALDLSVVLGSARRRSLPVATEFSSEIRPLRFIWFIAWLLPSHILSMCPSKNTSLAQRPCLQSCSMAYILSSPYLGPSLLTSNWLFQPGMAAFISRAITFHTGMERAVGCVPSTPALFW